jgi:iron complex outermembrane recepter protein
VPHHILKADMSVTARRAMIGATLVYTSEQFLRGDEANLLPPIDGSAVVNLAASYTLGRRLRIGGRVTNLFSADYASFGLLGEADDVLGEGFDDPRFVSPGAPRAAWIGIELSFR